MASLIEYFNNDFKGLSIDNIINVNSQTFQETVSVKQRVVEALNDSTRFFAFYIPETKNTLPVCSALLRDLPNFIKNANNIVSISGFVGDVTVGKHVTQYSNRVYLYTEILLDSRELEIIGQVATQSHLHIIIRSQDYAAKRNELISPYAFISHDHRDKDLIATRLANGLSSRLCFVWYDEYSLKIGDSLRESIEKGIKEAKKCILIVTPNYLNNPGWGKKEFNSIFTRELVMNEKIVIPIWHSVTKKEVYNYSPSLADTFALIWPDNLNKTQDEYNKEVEILISRVHTSIMN